jgi:hypothetical protein
MISDDDASRLVDVVDAASAARNKRAVAHLALLQIAEAWPGPCRRGQQYRARLRRRAARAGARDRAWQPAGPGAAGRVTARTSRGCDLIAPRICL